MMGLHGLRKNKTFGGQRIYSVCSIAYYCYIVAYTVVAYCHVAQRSGIRLPDAAVPRIVVPLAVCVRRSNNTHLGVCGKLGIN